MRPRWIALGMAALMVGALLAQGAQQPEPYPGSRNHEDPPKGWFCTPKAVQVSHRCACKNMAKDPDDPVCQSDTQEDPVCKVWCHKDHCMCQLACEGS